MSYRELKVWFAHWCATRWLAADEPKRYEAERRAEDVEHALGVAPGSLPLPADYDDAL